jgi:hypothetical protein
VQWFIETDNVQERYDGVSRKINVAQEITGFVQDLAERHLHELQLRVQSLAPGGRQGIQ